MGRGSDFFYRKSGNPHSENQYFQRFKYQNNRANIMSLLVFETLKNKDFKGGVNPTFPKQKILPSPLEWPLIHVYILVDHFLNDGWIQYP